MLGTYLWHTELHESGMGGKTRLKDEAARLVTAAQSNSVKPDRIKPNQTESNQIKPVIGKSLRHNELQESGNWVRRGLGLGYTIMSELVKPRSRKRTSPIDGGTVLKSYSECWKASLILG